MSILDTIGAAQANAAQVANTAQGGGQNAGGSSLQAFNQALEKAQTASGSTVTIDGMQVTNIQQVQAVGLVEAPAGTGAANGAGVPLPADVDQNARQNAIDGLGLGAEAATGVASAEGSTGGQSILDGLSRIRGAFDEQLAGVNEKVMGSSMDVTSMMAVHADVVKYSLLVDVSSKLAGKSTQAVDTLMKGQ